MGLALVGKGSPAPALNDIPGMLRMIADNIEDDIAKCPENVPATVLLVRCYPDESMTTSMIGMVMNKAQLVGSLHLAANEFHPGGTGLVRGHPQSPARIDEPADD